MSERLEEAAQLCDAAAEELERASQHCRTAAAHFRNHEIPRGAAHAWAAHGHLLAAQDAMGQQARTHAAHSVPQTG